MFDGGLAGKVEGASVTDAPTWQQVDRELRILAKDRGALDAREAPLLRLVVRMDVWKYVSKVSLYSYVEDVLGYGPKVARDRVRVAFALEQLPQLAAALASGEHSYTAIRELTRIVVPDTEAEWLDAVRDCNSARVQELVSMHRRGDRPTDPVDLDAKLCPITFEVAPSIVARLRAYQRELGDELGDAVDDTMLFDALLASAESAGDGTSPRAQVQLTVCEYCDQGFVDVDGRRVPIDDDERDLLECDAVRIGSDRQPARATKDVTQATRRAVWHRERNRCVVPGCRSTRHVDVHHVVPRAAGGGHGPDNLVLLCAGHHRLHHAGKITLARPTSNTNQPRVGLELTDELRDLTLERPTSKTSPHRAGETRVQDSRDLGLDRPTANRQPRAGLERVQDFTFDRPTANTSQLRAGLEPRVQDSRDLRPDRPTANRQPRAGLEPRVQDLTLDRPTADRQARAGLDLGVQDLRLDRPTADRQARAGLEPRVDARDLRLDRPMANRQARAGLEPRVQDSRDLRLDRPTANRQGVEGLDPRVQNLTLDRPTVSRQAHAGLEPRVQDLTLDRQTTNTSQARAKLEPRVQDSRDLRLDRPTANRQGGAGLDPRVQDLTLDRPTANRQAHAGLEPRVQDLTLDRQTANTSQPRAGLGPRVQDSMLNRPTANTSQPRAGLEPRVQDLRDLRLDRPMANRQAHAGLEPRVQDSRDLRLDRPMANRQAHAGLEPRVQDLTLDRPTANTSQPRAGLEPRVQDLMLDRPTANTSQPRAGREPQPANTKRTRASHSAKRHVATSTSSPARVSYARVAMKTDATQALVQLGFTRSEARSMVEQASSTTSADVELQELIVAALRFATIVKTM